MELMVFRSLRELPIPLAMSYLAELCSRSCVAVSLRALITYGTSFYRIEMLALLNDMIIVDRYLWG